MASLNWTVHDYFRVFAPTHWGFDPQVSPDRSNGCRVFQLRADGSERFLTCAFSHDSLDMEKSTIQMFSWTFGIYDPDLFATHEDTERQSGKALTSYFLLPIQWSWVTTGFPTRSFPSINTYSGLRILTLQFLPPICRSWMTTDIPMGFHPLIRYLSGNS
jgi:hypothetical protein